MTWSGKGLYQGDYGPVNIEGKVDGVAEAPLSALRLTDTMRTKVRGITPK